MHFGWAELLIICVICVMIFGVGKFQNIGKLLGKNINDFKSEVKNSSDENNKEIVRDITPELEKEEK